MIVSIRVDVDRLISALQRAKGQQVENGHSPTHVHIVTSVNEFTDGISKLSLEGDEGQTYYRAAVETVATC